MLYWSVKNTNAHSSQEFRIWGYNSRSKTNFFLLLMMSQWKQLIVWNCL